MHVKLGSVNQFKLILCLCFPTNRKVMGSRGSDALLGGDVSFGSRPALKHTAQVCSTLLLR